MSRVVVNTARAWLRAGSAKPVSGPQELPVQPVFRASRLGLPVVAPFRGRRQGHQDRLDPPARLQAEQRAAIVDEIELDVAAAAIGLKIPLALAVRHPAAALGNGDVGGQKMIADAAQERKAAVESALVQIVEKNPADAARLVPMPQLEIFVAPALEAGVAVCAERRERVTATAVKVARVLLESIIRRQIHPAPEPPDRLAARRRCKEEPHIHVHGGDEGIARMQYQRDTQGLEAATGELRACGARRGRK